MSTYANRSSYETVLRIASVFFGLSIYLILDRRSVLFLPAVTCFFLGAALVWSLLDKRALLVARNEKRVALDRSAGHILIDALSETCRTTTFSFLVFCIRSNSQFLFQGIRLSYEATILVALVAGYVAVLLYYLDKARQERESLGSEGESTPRFTALRKRVDRGIDAAAPIAYAAFTATHVLLSAIFLWNEGDTGALFLFGISLLVSAFWLHNILRGRRLAQAPS